MVLKITANILLHIFLTLIKILNFKCQNKKDKLFRIFLKFWLFREKRATVSKQNVEFWLNITNDRKSIITKWMQLFPVLPVPYSLRVVATIHPSNDLKELPWINSLKYSNFMDKPIPWIIWKWCLDNDRSCILWKDILRIFSRAWSRLLTRPFYSNNSLQILVFIVQGS